MTRCERACLFSSCCRCQFRHNLLWVNTTTTTGVLQNVCRINKKMYSIKYAEHCCSCQYFQLRYHLMPFLPSYFVFCFCFFSYSASLRNLFNLLFLLLGRLVLYRVQLNGRVHSTVAPAAERLVVKDASFFSPRLTSPCSVGQD